MKPSFYDAWSDRPEISTVLGSLPTDERRDELTTAYRDAVTALKATRERVTVLTVQSDEIVRDMAHPTAPTGKRRETLLERRAALDVERGLLPQLLKLQAENLARAYLDWYSYVEGQLQEESRRVQHELDEIQAERSPHQLVRSRATQSTAMAEHMAGQVTAAKRALDATWHRLSDAMARKQAVDRALALVHVGMSNTFGEHARSAAPRDGDVRRFVDRAAKMAA